jgi:hypothetical protein
MNYNKKMPRKTASRRTTRKTSTRRVSTRRGASKTRKPVKKLVRIPSRTRTVRVRKASRRTRVFTPENATPWQVEHQSYGIGPLKKNELGRYGYSSFETEKKRDESLRKASRAYGSLSVFRKLNALYVYNKNTNPRASRVFLKDRDYVRKSLM